MYPKGKLSTLLFKWKKLTDSGFAVDAHILTAPIIMITG